MSQLERRLAQLEALSRQRNDRLNRILGYADSLEAYAEHLERQRRRTDALLAMASGQAKPGEDPAAVQVSYPDGQGILRRLIEVATARGFAIDGLSIEDDPSGAGTVGLTLLVRGTAPIDDLADAFSAFDGVQTTVGRRQAPPEADANDDEGMGKG